MKPTRGRKNPLILQAELELYRSLCIERAKIIARLRELDNREISTFMPTIFAETAHVRTDGRMVKD